MKIASTNLQMASSHASLKQHEIRESLNMWVGQQRPSFEGQGRPPNRPAADPVQLSEAGRAAQSADRIDQEVNAAVDKDPGLNLIRRMLEFLTGEKIRLFNVDELRAESSESQAQASEVSTRPAAGYGVEYERHESYTEIEQTSFSAAGSVKTADGREISFQIELSMSRTYHEESSVSLRLGDAARKTDPLVLNFAGTASELTDQRFDFDLNADGKQDRVNFVGSGSGFLVFDRNQDGRINNGREMFGPASGDGFSELSQLDDDSNGWIDENDAAYRQLQIWSRDPAGHDRLESLASAKVGAIALERIVTPFELKNNSNEILGSVRSSGVFLQEDGKAGTIQQVDLTV